MNLVLSYWGNFLKGHSAKFFCGNSRLLASVCSITQTHTHTFISSDCFHSSRLSKTKRVFWWIIRLLITPHLSHLHHICFPLFIASSLLSSSSHVGSHTPVILTPELEDKQLPSAAAFQLSEVHFICKENRWTWIMRQLWLAKLEVVDTLCIIYFNLPCKRRLWWTRASPSDGSDRAGHFSELQVRLRVHHVVSLIICIWRHVVHDSWCCASVRLFTGFHKMFSSVSLDDEVWRSSITEM